MLLQFLINGLIAGLLISLTAIAFGITYNATKIFHMAFAAVLISASYLMLFFLNAGINTILSFILAVGIAGILNMLIEYIVYKPMETRGNSVNTILVASIGIFIIIINVLALLFGFETQVLDKGIGDSWHLANGIIITEMQIWQLFVSVVLIIITFFILLKTKAGLQLRAISNDPELFIVFGKNTYKTRRLLFFISGSLGAIISLLISFDGGFDPYAGMPLLLNGMVAMILGGIGNYKGAIIGGLLLGIIKNLMVYSWEAKWETAITFGILLLVLIIRPQGLLGVKQRLI